MKINLDKTKILVFRNGGQLKEIEKWFYNGNPVEVVSFYKYLCILHLNWFGLKQKICYQNKR